MVDTTKFKTRAIQHAIGDEDLIRALTHDTRHAQTEDASDLVWKCIFPYLRLDGAQEEETSNLLFEVNELEAQRNSSVLKDMELIVTVLCSSKLMRYTEGTRIDYIAGRIVALFNKNYKFSGKQLMLKSNIAYVLTGGYYHYRTLIFTTQDLNGTAC